MVRYNRHFIAFAVAAAAPPSPPLPPVFYEFELIASMPASAKVGEHCIAQYRAGEDLWILKLTVNDFRMKPSIELVTANGRKVNAEVAFAAGANRNYKNFEHVVFEKGTIFSNSSPWKFNQDIGVCVRVLGKRAAPLYEASLDTSDVAFKVGNEGELVKAHKTYLSMISSVFSRMFNAEFCEKDADEVDLTTDESLKADVFKAFIEAVYPDRVGPNDKNVLALVELAHRYDVKFLLKDCEKFLVGCSKVPFVEKFFYAEKYELTGLQDYLTRTLRASDAEEIFKDVRSKTLNSYTLSFLRQRL